MAFGTRATLTELPTNRFRNASRVTYFKNSNFIAKICIALKCKCIKSI